MTQRYDWHPRRRPGFRDLRRVSWRGWVVFVLAMAGLVALGIADKQSHYELLARVQRTLCQFGVGSCILHFQVSVHTRLVVNEPISIAGTKVFVAGGELGDERLDPQYQALIERKVTNAGGSIVGQSEDADLQISLTVSNFAPASFWFNPHPVQITRSGSGQTTRTVKLFVYRIESGGRPARPVALRYGEFTSFGAVATPNDVVAFALDTMFERFAMVPATGTEGLWMTVDHSRRQ